MTAENIRNLRLKKEVIFRMLEGIQQSYPGVGYAPQIGQQSGYPVPFGGAIGSGVAGLFGNPLNPLTQAHLQQQVPFAQQQLPFGQQQVPFAPPGFLTNPLAQWGNQIGGIGQPGRVPYDPVTAAYLQQIQQQILQQLLASSSLLGQVGRPMGFGLDPITVAYLQQAQLANLYSQPWGMQHAGGQYGRPPFQSQIGVGAYGPLSPVF